MERDEGGRGLTSYSAAFPDSLFPRPPWERSRAAFAFCDSEEKLGHAGRSRWGWDLAPGRCTSCLLGNVMASRGQEKQGIPAHRSSHSALQLCAQQSRY